MRSKPRRKTTSATKPARPRSARLRKITPLSREMAIGAAALGILSVVLLITMFAAHPRARSTVADAAPASAPASTPSIEETAPEPAAPVAPAESTTGMVTAPATITGCLERSADAFRLKDTEGDDAPRARSWKTGFLKKAPAQIDVIDAANRFALANHVGERVTVTGTLIDREIRVRSLHRVASSCSAKTRV